MMPVLPFYLSEVFHAGNTMVGVVLSCYTIAALCIRPFSGYLLDTFARKPLYLLAYSVFTAIFAGYIVAGTLTVFIMLRIVHGVSFGTVTVGGNTVVIDIMPSSRRGEGTGLLRAGQQHCHVHRPHGGSVHARCGRALYRHLLQFAGILRGGTGLRLAGQDALQTARKTPARFAGPLHPVERNARGVQSAAALHSPTA